MPFDSIDSEKIISSPFVVGLAGGVVALKGAPGKTWLERVFNAGCGALLAGFLSEAAAEWLGLKTPQMQSAIAFLIGLFGMSMVASANTWLSRVALSDVIPWLGKKD